MAHSIIRALPVLFVWQLVSVVTGFFTQVFLARSLGPHDKGILDLFLLIPIVASSVVDVGLLSANTYFAGKGTASLRTLHANTLLWSIFVGMATIIIGFFLTSVGKSPFESLTTSQFLLSISLILPSLYVSLWSGLMYGTGQSVLVYRITGAISLASLAAYGLALLGGAQLESVLWISIALITIKALIPLVHFSRSVGLEFSMDFSILKQSIKYGVALYVGIALNMLHFRFSQFFVESYLGPFELGYYALAVRIAELIWLLDFVVINASVFNITSSSLEESARITQRMTRMIGLMVILFALAVGLASPQLIPLVFGKDFAPAVTPLLLLLPGIVAWSVGRSVAQFISYQVGKPWLNTQAAAFAFVLNIILNILLIPTFGVAGASLAATFSYFSITIVLSLIFRKLASVKLLSTFIPQRDDFLLLRDTVLKDIRLFMAGKR
ncbi:MAG: polysaccharide biosynthesis C-terminal domain-containing protein [Ignavibacteriae bacterium]|nr:polysaccharide biosynthesis C-terminal domain-containing protein [Ignavibacteriota bacterium]